MNTYSKLIPNVFVAKCTEQHQKGETIPVTTKYGKDNNCIVFNLIYEKDGFYFYSIVRADGYNAQTRAENKVNKYNGWALSAENKSDQYYNASKEGADFLALGEPIKVGHHSERRHRALIERNWNRMGKSVEFSNKAAEHESKAEYWAKRTTEVNLSMPESIEYFEFKLEAAKELHEGLKSGKIARSHSFSLTYANKDVKELTDKVKWAKRLWA